VATVYNELAQEIAYFFLLTKHCYIRIPVTLAMNFMGGLSVMLGAIITLFDILSNNTGCILAMGGQRLCLHCSGQVFGMSQGRSSHLVATWEKSMLARRGEHCRVPVKAGHGPEAELLAKLVALHISAHLATRVTKGCLAFQEKLNKGMAWGQVSRAEMNAQLF
jgi:cytochrome b